MLSKFWSFKRVQSSFEWKFLFCTILIGLFCGVMSLSLWQTAIAGFGISFPTTVSLLLVGSIAFDLGWNRSVNHKKSPVQFLLIASMLLLFWMALFPEFCILLLKMFSFLSAETFSSDIRLLAPVLFVTAILFSLPCYLMGAIPTLLSQLLVNLKKEEGASGSTVNSIFFGSLSFGLFLNLYLLSPLMGQYFAGILTGTALGILFLLSWFSLSKHYNNQLNDVEPINDSPQSKPRIRSFSFNQVSATFNLLLLGAIGAILSLIVTQLWPSFAHQVYSQIGMLLIGFSIGFAILGWKKINAVNSQPFFTCLLLLTLLLFPEIVNSVLESNATLQGANQILIFRTLVIGIFFLPFGMICAFSITPLQKEERIQKTAFGFTCLSFGYLAGKYLLSGISSLETLLLVIVLLQSTQLLYTFWRERAQVKKFRFALVPLLLSMVAVVFPNYFNHYSPQLSAKRLFSSKVMFEYNQGISGELLDQIDETRLVTTKNSWYGTYTLWKTFGSHLEIRQNGKPLGMVSTFPEAFPQYSGEVFRTIFPLIMHQNPESILIHGNMSGVPLKTALSFPVQHISCLEEDPALLELIRENIWTNKQGDVESDKRVEIKSVNPYLMTLLNGDQYDVIISNPPESSLLKASSCYTSNFYRNINQQLTNEGVFCQYFRAVEYGATPVKGLFKTFQSAFKKSLAVEVGVNEYLLLGTNSESGLIRKDLINRLKARHVREVLSQIGWDWSVPLSLRVYQLDELKHENKIAENTLRNNWFSFLNPREFVRWGNKQKEIQDQLVKLSIRVVDLPGIDNQDPQILRRMREVVSQFKILSDNPDRSEAYRKVLKKQLMKPRLAMIQQVNYESSQGNQLHPIEEHRKSYIKALGKAVKKRKPKLGLIQDIVNHMEPYDPLVTYFAHHEIAELLSRTGNDPSYELQCRLHMIYYSNAKDRSVRNIAAVIQLLTDHPELIEKNEDRLDVLNGMLQQLKYRWELRRNSAELKPEIALNDVKYSMDAIDQSFSMIEGLVPIENYSAEDWTSRRKYLEKKLVRPLHTYRTTILPRHHQRRNQIDNMKINESIEKELKMLKTEQR
jgi:Spermine/spermidine synthase domain